jgi:hypothetical protein
MEEKRFYSCPKIISLKVKKRQRESKITEEEFIKTQTTYQI